MGAVTDMQLFERARCDFDTYSNAFISATGLDLDLIHSQDAVWESVASRIHSPWCQRATSGCTRRQECGRTLEHQLDLANTRPMGEFVSCDCPVHLRFSVTLLEKLGDARIYLLVGRVPVGSESDTGRSLTVSEVQYAASLKLLEK